MSAFRICSGAHLESLDLQCELGTLEMQCQLSNGRGSFSLPNLMRGPFIFAYLRAMPSGGRARPDRNNREFSRAVELAFMMLALVTPIGHVYVLILHTSKSKLIKRMKSIKLTQKSLRNTGLPS
jgi:hypothetical protein